MNRLYDIAESCIEQTGIFQNFKPLFCNENKKFNKTFSSKNSTSTRQNGIVRVNCVDCLDRTNTAMFVIGKCAFAYQLQALGIISAPFIEADGACEKMLIDLYEKSGDSIAQQYAGSQLVHRVDTYGKNSIASQLRDNMHTITRAYSNAFSDADKQNAINIFLGVFQPSKSSIPIWELPTDIYLHDKYINEPWNFPKNYTSWLDCATFECLPKSSEEELKSVKTAVKTYEKFSTKHDFRIDVYDNYYKPYKLSAFHEVYYYNILQVSKANGNSISNLTSGLKAIMIDPLITLSGVKRVSESTLMSNRSPQLNPQSNASSDSETDDSVSISQEVSPRRNLPTKEVKSSPLRVLPQSKALVPTGNKSFDVYRKYVESQTKSDSINFSAVKKTPALAVFVTNNEKTKQEETAIPKAKQQSIELFKVHLNVGTIGPREPSAASISLYQKYLQPL